MVVLVIVHVSGNGSLWSKIVRLSAPAPPPLKVTGPWRLSRNWLGAVTLTTSLPVDPKTFTGRLAGVSSMYTVLPEPSATTITAAIVPMVHSPSTALVALFTASYRLLLAGSVR